MLKEVFFGVQYVESMIVFGSPAGERYRFTLSGRSAIVPVIFAKRFWISSRSILSSTVSPARISRENVPRRCRSLVLTKIW